MHTNTPCRFVFLLLAAFCLFLRPASSSAAPVLADDFESGMSGWTQWSGAASSWFTTANPLNVGDTVLSSTNSGRTEAVVRTLGASFSDSMVFSFDMYSGNAGPSWNFRGLVLTGTSSTAPGYGFYILENGGVQILRYDQGWASLNGSAGAPVPVEIATGSAAAGVWKTNDWNTVSFQWLQDGGFTLSINNSIVATAMDKTHDIKAARLVFQKFTNNSSSGDNPVSGRVLLFDNVSIAPIPEPAAATMVMAIIALGVTGGRVFSRRRR